MTVRSFGQRLVGTFAIEFVSGVLRLATPLVLARAIGAQAYGLYATVTGLTALVFSLASSGVPLAATYYGATYPGRSTTERVLRCSGMLALAGSLASLPFAWLYQGVALAEVSLWLIGLALTAAVPFGLELTAVGVLRGHSRVEEASALGLLRQVSLLCIAGALLVLGGGLDASVIAFVATGSAISLLAMIVALGSTPSAPASPPGYRQILGYAGQVQASTLLTFLNYRVGLFILAAIVPATELGMYAAATAVAEAIWFFSHTASSVLAGQVARATSDREALELTARACRLVTGASILAASFFACLSPVLMSAFGIGFREGWDVLVVSLFAACLLAPSRVLATHRAAVGSPHANIRGTAAGVVVNVILTAALTPLWGALGAAFANAVGYAVVAIDRVARFIRPSSGERVARARELLWPNTQDLRALAGMTRARLGRSGR